MTLTLSRGVLWPHDYELLIDPKVANFSPIRQAPQIPKGQLFQILPYSKKILIPFKILYYEKIYKNLPTLHNLEIGLTWF